MMEVDNDDTAADAATTVDTTTTMQQQQQQQQPHVWSAFYDEEGTLYYYNNDTQESAWEPPPNGEDFNPPPSPAPAPAPAGDDDDDEKEEHGAPADDNDDKAATETKTTAEKDGDPAGANIATGTNVGSSSLSSSTTKWLRYKVDDDDDDGGGGNTAYYFYNTETGDRQWEEPAEGFVDAPAQDEDKEEEEEATAGGGENNNNNNNTDTAAAAAATKSAKEHDDDTQQREHYHDDGDVDMEDVSKKEDEASSTATAAKEGTGDNKGSKSFIDAASAEEVETAAAAAAAAATETADAGQEVKHQDEENMPDASAPENGEEPASTATTAAAAAAAAAASHNSGSSSDKATTSKWVRYQDDGGADYYYNMDTQATQWEVPDEGFIEAEEYEAAGVGGDTTTIDEQQQQQDGVGKDFTKEAAGAVVGPASIWTRHQDEEGNDYYFNTETDETQWDMPEGFVEAAVAPSLEVDEATVDETLVKSEAEKAAPSDDEKEQEQDISMDAAEDATRPASQEAVEPEPAPEPEEEIDPAVKRLQDAENALNQPDSILEPSCFENVTEVVSSQGGNPQKALTALLDNYQGQTAICGLLAQWLASLRSTTPGLSDKKPSAIAGGNIAAVSAAGDTGSSDAMAEDIRTTIQDVINRTATQRFSKEAGDSILNLSKREAAFLDDMMESTRWRKLLIDLSASHKDSAVLNHCLDCISERGHYREIAKRINIADRFPVFRKMLQSELAAIGRLAVSAGADPATSNGMEDLVNDLRRTCTARSYTYLYSLQVLRALESEGRKALLELEKESDDPGTIRLRRSVRKWEALCQVLEDTMVDPAVSASEAMSSPMLRKRRLDVALTINELTQRQRKRRRPGDEEDNDNGTNGNAQDDSSQRALETALLRFIRQYALGVQVDASSLDPLLPSGLDQVNAAKQIGGLLMKHALAVRALLSYLYKPGSTRVTDPVVKNKCARLIALAVRSSEEVARTEYKGPNARLGENDESTELSDEVVLTRVILEGSQLCEQLESMVSFLVSVGNREKNNGSGMPPGLGQKLCTLAFKYAPIAQGVMIWAREFTHGNEFASSASFPTLSVSILSLTRLVASKQPFTRGDALTIALQFLKHTNPDVSYQKINAIKEQSLRLLIHLLMQGEVAAVMNAMTTRLQQQSSSELDASLIRYFVAGVLEVVRPPVSCAFVRLFSQLLLSRLCIDAVRSTYFGPEHRERLDQLVLAFPKVRTLNGKMLEGDDMALVNSLMATYQITSD